MQHVRRFASLSWRLPIVLSLLLVPWSAESADKKRDDGVQLRPSERGVVVPGDKIIMARPVDRKVSAALSPDSIENKLWLRIGDKWDTQTIYVCWENPTQNDENARTEVKKSVHDSWEAHSHLKFGGWKTCEERFKGVRIRIQDCNDKNCGPHTKGLGKTLSGVKNGMVLNFTYEHWGQACQTTRSSCNVSIAVHEFGHALGFAHEHNRPDTPGECMEKKQGPDGDSMLTSWDPKSVMNYCNPVYNNDGKLSEKDIEGLQLAYGRPES